MSGGKEEALREIILNELIGFGRKWVLLGNPFIAIYKNLR